MIKAIIRIVRCPCPLIMTFTFFMVPRRYNMIKAIISCRVRCPNHNVTCQTFHGSTNSFLNVEKLGTDVSFTNSLNHCPQHHRAKRASIETTRVQSVIVTSQLLAASSCTDDVTIGQQFEYLGAVTGLNVDLPQLSRYTRGQKCWVGIFQ